MTASQQSLRVAFYALLVVTGVLFAAVLLVHNRVQQPLREMQKERDSEEEYPRVVINPVFYGGLTNWQIAILVVDILARELGACVTNYDFPLSYDKPYYVKPELFYPDIMKPYLCQRYRIVGCRVVNMDGIYWTNVNVDDLITLSQQSSCLWINVQNPLKMLLYRKGQRVIDHRYNMSTEWRQFYARSLNIGSRSGTCVHLRFDADMIKDQPHVHRPEFPLSLLGKTIAASPAPYWIMFSTWNRMTEHLITLIRSNASDILTKNSTHLWNAPGLREVNAWMEEWQCFSYRSFIGADYSSFSIKICAIFKFYGYPCYLYPRAYIELVGWCLDRHGGDQDAALQCVLSPPALAGG